MTKLQNHSVVEASLRRLRAMGLDVHLMPESDNEVNIFVNLPSILKLIERNIEYPNRRVYFEKPFIVVNLWKGRAYALKGGET